MDPEDRPQNYLSQKFDALRKVPGYSNFIQERFERCLDLYLCPRQRKVRVRIDFLILEISAFCTILYFRLCVFFSDFRNVKCKH